MTGLWMTAKLDLAESFRARWFLVYSLVFGGALVLLLLSGLAESRVMGFSGLSRILIIYVQLCMAILPVFILLTTVRSVAGDREAGVIEYLLALPVSLSGWYWGKLTGRFVVVFAPVFLAMAAAAAGAGPAGEPEGVVPWVRYPGCVPWHCRIHIKYCRNGFEMGGVYLLRPGCAPSGAPRGRWPMAGIRKLLVLLTP